MIRNYIYILLLLIVGCTEPYDIDLGSTVPNLVVEGSVTTDSLHQQVILTKTADYFYNKPAEGVNDAVVFVTFNSDTMWYKYEEGSQGIYQSEVAFRGIEYTKYTLHIDSVQLTDNGNKKTYIASDSMRSIVPIDSVSTEYDDQIEAWWVRIHTEEPSESVDWYIFKTGINSNVVSDTISEWWIAEDEFLSDNYLDGIDVQYLQDEYDDERPVVGDTIWLYMENISEEYHDFCEQVQVEIEEKIPLFSGQPANVSTNILPDGVGFFSAVAKTKDYTIVTEVPFEGYGEEE